MTVIGFEVRKRAPYCDGQPFGTTGAYERVDGVLQFAVAPEHPANQSIVDLTLAPNDLEGRVRFAADVCLLVPVDPTRGNRRLLLELPNRGRKLVPRHFNRAPTEVPPTANILPGDGFLLRRGYSLGWIGWQWDVVRNAALMGLEAPQARIDGQPIRGRTVVRFQPNAPHRTHLLADRVHEPYPADDVDEQNAVLTVRDWAGGKPTTIPRADWRFASDTGGKVVSDAEHVYLRTGFQPGKVYEVIYTTNRSPVVGVGLLAVRDAASYLHYAMAADNPCAGALDKVYGFGMSQTGRMLRHLLYLGLNLDESGRMAFDGLIPHVGGARRGEFNHRYAQPSVQATPGVGHLPPFDDAGLFARQRSIGGMPKVIQTNSSAEYWRGDCALAHIDVLGTSDLPAEPGTRMYLFAGTQHGPGGVPLTNYNPNDGGRGRYGFNCLDYTPLLRAALINLDRWVSDGLEPPPSVHPRIDASTALPPTDVLETFSRLHAVHLPDPERLPRIRRVEAGLDIAGNVARLPITEGDPYPSFVSAVDADGNEVAGIRLPDLTVPLATLTGWNPRHPETGAPEQIMSMQGATHFFARTRAEREASGDPRPAIEERYAGREDYLARVRTAALALASERHIVDEDVETLVSDAATRWDAVYQATEEKG